MPGTFNQQQITASLLVWWRDTVSLAVAAVGLGTVLDTAVVGEWVEVFVERWAWRPQRAGAPERVELSLVVQCFVSPGRDKGRVQELADAARAVFSRQTVPVHDYDASGPPLVGYVSLLEPEVRDLSRSQVSSLRQGMEQLVLTWRGVAEQV